MRRTASEVLSDLEIRVARLEKQSKRKEILPLDRMLNKLQREFRIQFTEWPSIDGEFLEKGEYFILPDFDEVAYAVRNRRQIRIEDKYGASWSLSWE
jgi:hypothetical protein